MVEASNNTTSITKGKKVMDYDKEEGKKKQKKEGKKVEV